MFEVTVTHVPPLVVASLEHNGPYDQLPFQALADWCLQRNLLRKEARCIAAFTSHEPAVSAPYPMSKACFSVAEDAAGDADVSIETIFGGTYAILHYRGPYAAMSEAGRWFFQEWLPQSGRQLVGDQSFDEYLNDSRTTPPDQLRTDIYFPLAI
ncbi:AraC family transcriptional regulator [Microvirga roseola]|uniref:AraC family transcriptional regulator n=1 Tax=Microvirga roseola TaxID=2883126 RepID=UPI001E37FE6D|nr:GyrI-like domain-containing protein [Microvirga roseola]